MNSYLPQKRFPFLQYLQFNFIPLATYLYFPNVCYSLVPICKRRRGLNSIFLTNFTTYFTLLVYYITLQFDLKQTPLSPPVPFKDLEKFLLLDARTNQAQESTRKENNTNNMVVANFNLPHYPAFDTSCVVSAMK